MYQIGTGTVTLRLPCETHLQYPHGTEQDLFTQIPASCELSRTHQVPLHCCSACNEVSVYHSEHIMLIN
jgi:hypothetical protein